MVTNEEKAKCDSCIVINDNNEYSFSRIPFIPYQHCRKGFLRKSKREPQFLYCLNVHVELLYSINTSPERLDFIPFFLKRWPSYLVFAVQIKSMNQIETIEKIKSLQLPNRVTVILMITKNNRNKFYVNKLRNIAITSFRTTHFLVLDMDLWPLGIM